VNLSKWGGVLDRTHKFNSQIQKMTKKESKSERRDKGPKLRMRVTRKARGGESQITILPKNVASTSGGHATKHLISEEAVSRASEYENKAF